MSDATKGPSTPTQVDPMSDSVLPPKAGIPLVVFLLLGFGLTVSGYLEYLHYSTFMRPSFESFCSVGQALDCVTVAASPYSTILGVPWAVWGILGFATMTWAAFKRSIWLLPLAFSGAALSAALLGVSLLLVGSVCLLCEATHLTAWALALSVWKNRGRLLGKLGDKSGALDLFAAPAGLALALIVLFPKYWDAFSYKGEPPFPTGVTKEGHHWIGAENPKIVLHEFVDYACGHCKIHSAHTLRALRKHPELRVVRRHRSKIRCMSDNPKACSHVRSAYCADQQSKFWQADRWLFAHAPAGFSEPDVAGMARDLRLDRDALERCVASQEAYGFAAAQAEEAKKWRIDSTPAYVMDGKRAKLKQVQELLK